ncbi:MAG: putative metal-dependent hydrolase [Saprospiraceae bacterium]|nr:putative metal-dependent hydrolase [Saprospiraceae bacterium]
MENLQYPIGKYEFPESFTKNDIEGWINDIAQAPELYRKLAERMTEAQMETAYRPGGWTARQVLHHVPDSHIQAYGRFKLVLTEDSPTIKPYHEDLWAQLPDTQLTPISVSLSLLDALHQRWVVLMQNMKPSDFEKIYIHPQYGKKYPLGAVCKLYAWHGRHHLAHLQIILDSVHS